MDKRIIHLRIPVDENYKPTISSDIARKITKQISGVVKDDYYVIASPFELESNIDGLIININGENYGYEEIVKILEDRCTAVKI